MKEGQVKNPKKETVIVTTPTKKVTLASPSKEEVNVIYVELLSLLGKACWGRWGWVIF